uniref:GNAT family N-acetyltransferase n=1 Tax=Angiostrongylus cantonensis TaxID=6313 RepID=A0A0K0D2S6_ANGCA
LDVPILECLRMTNPKSNNGKTLSNTWEKSIRAHII